MKSEYVLFALLLLLALLHISFIQVQVLLQFYRKEKRMYRNNERMAIQKEYHEMSFLKKIIVW